MASDNPGRDNAGRIAGQLGALLLAVLEDGPLHGYAVIEALQRRSAGELALPTGTVYPALRRLENAGWLRGSWSTVNGRRRRTYALTASGRHALADRRADWLRLSGTIHRVLGGSPRPRPEGGAAR